MLVGDVVLCVKGNDLASIIIWFVNILSSFFSKNKFNKSNKYVHIAIASGENKIIEAGPGGVIERDVNHYTGYAICRLKSLTDQQRVVIYKFIKESAGRDYSYWLVFIIGILKFFNAERLINGIGYDGFICSVLVAKAYKKVGYCFKKDEHIDFIDPKDIADCILYNDIKNWDIMSAK